MVLKKLTAYSCAPRELKITTFHALCGEKSRKDFRGEQRTNSSDRENFSGRISDGNSQHQLSYFRSLEVLPDYAKSQVAKCEEKSPKFEEKGGANRFETAVWNPVENMTPYQPTSFSPRKHLLWPCVKVDSMPSRDNEEAETQDQQTFVPHGIGKRQTWINRRLNFEKRRVGPKNMFDQTVTVSERPGRWSAVLDGPPRVDSGWMGNLEAPAYRTDHRESFQNELCRQRKPVHPLSVVRLGYGHTDALERRYQTTYRRNFKHPDNTANRGCV